MNAWQCRRKWKHMFKLTIVFIQTVRYVCPKCKMYLSKFWMERVRSKVHEQAYCRSCYFTCCAIWQKIFYLAFPNIHHTSTLLYLLYSFVIVQKYRMGKKLKSYIHMFHKLYITRPIDLMSMVGIWQTFVAFLWSSLHYFILMYG